MFTKDGVLQKVDNLNNKCAKLILNLALINNSNEKIAEIKSLLRSITEIEQNRNIESVVGDSIRAAGFEYDNEQDIFYSVIDAWQYDYGYCRLYDEFSAPLSMIFDCDPIYFEYNNKNWLIEFWKGQYGICTGFEVGVYASEKNKDESNEISGDDIFYNKISSEEFLDISFVAKKMVKIFL